MKVLVVQIKMIGDVLASSVICEAIKKRLPDAEIHYLIQKNTFPVVEQNPFIDKVIFFEPSIHKGFSGLFSLGKQFQSEKYDAVLDVYGKWASLIPTLLSKAPKRIGFSKSYKNIFYTAAVVPKKNISGEAIVHRLQLAEAFLNEKTDIDFPKIYLTENEISEARKKLAKLNTEKPIVMISVLGSDVSKSLPASYMAELLDNVASEKEVLMLFNFMPKQATEAKAIFDLCQPKTQNCIKIDFYTQSLRDFLAVLSQCDALIGNEGGAVNMAKALRINTFTVFSPWIEKKSWDMLEDEASHVAVHLRDYFPEIYTDEHPKKFKKKALAMYQLLQPNLFREKLNHFLHHI